MKENDTQAHWRDSAITPQFFVVDARAAFAVLLLLFRPSWLTLGIAVAVIAFLAFLNSRRLPVTVTFRIIKGWLSGSKKILVLKR